jgi:hypothetical protein
MAWTLDALRAYPVSGRRPARLEGGWDNETAARNPNRKGAPREVVLANLNGHQKQVPHGRPGVDWERALRRTARGRLGVGAQSRTDGPG